MNFTSIKLPLKDKSSHRKPCTHYDPTYVKKNLNVYILIYINAHIEKDLEKYTLRLDAIKGWVFWKQTQHRIWQVGYLRICTCKRDGEEAGLCKKLNSKAMST